MRSLCIALLFAGCAKGPDVTIAESGRAKAAVTVMTEALATKESGPKETVATFGEVYAFSPATIQVHRDEPTAITFWNLQADDDHDFMLMNDRNAVLTQFKLPPLKKTTRVFTFHRDGLYRFVCTMHKPEMAGAVVVVPPPL
jgi:plastocyanin